MKAIVQDAYGTADVLRLAAIDPPTIGADDVLVRVRAVGIDPGLWHLMVGTPYLPRLAFGLRAPRNPVPGSAFAGTVETVGATVTGLAPGDPVYGVCTGALGEYARARAGKIARTPATLTFEQAAAVPISAVTALQGLRDVGKVRAGQSVLVIGAAGGVGAYAVQLAKGFGAHVTGACSTSKVNLVRSLGADEVLDYTCEDLTDGTRRFDLILDTAGSRPLWHLRRALTPRGTLVIVGGEGGGKVLGIGRQLRAVAVSPFLRQNLRMLVSVEKRADLETLAALIDDGAVRPVVDRAYPLAEAAEAIRHWESGTVRGKVVVTL